MIVVEKVSSVLVGDGDDNRTQCLRKWGGLRSPLAYARVRGEARRKVLRRFPYVLIYFVKPAHLEVIAVFHTSRDPVGWQERAR